MFLTFQVRRHQSDYDRGREETQLTCLCVHVQDEFGSLNPLIPAHYLYLCRRFYRAVQENNFKVTQCAPWTAEAMLDIISTVLDLRALCFTGLRQRFIIQSLEHCALLAVRLQLWDSVQVCFDQKSLCSLL